MLLFVHILRHFWCSVIILVTVSSNLSNFGKKISPAKKNKNKKKLYPKSQKFPQKTQYIQKKSKQIKYKKKTMYTQTKKKFHRKKEEQNAILLVLPFEEICL